MNSVELFGVLQGLQHLMKKKAENPNLDDTELIKQRDHEKKTFELWKTTVAKWVNNINFSSRAVKKRRKLLDRLISSTADSTVSKFKHYLTKRGGRCDLNFNHTEGILTMDKAKLASQRDGVQTKNLSGGESTTIQLCFLMSLFVDTACHFHVLDEIDVFLDNPNRSSLIKNLNTMTQTIDKQWIFLTPHDTSCVK